MPNFAQCVIHDRGVTYKPGDEVPDDISGLDELIEGGAVGESYTPPERDPVEPDTSDLTPTSPEATIVGADSAGASEDQG